MRNRVHFGCVVAFILALVLLGIPGRAGAQASSDEPIPMGPPETGKPKVEPKSNPKDSNEQPPIDMPKSGKEQPKKTQTKEDHDKEVKEVLTYLMTEYAHMWDNPDWLTRCLGCLSAVRLPNTEATDMLLGDAKNDKYPVVSLVSWHCSLSRAKIMNKDQWKKFVDLTPELHARGVFNGNLRADLLRVMATVPPDARWKSIWGKIFDQTNCLRPEDMEVLDELGDCLKAWKSPSLVESLINGMQNLHSAYRAEYVLQRAGCDVPWAGNRMDQTSQQMWAAAIADYVAWWKKEKGSWKEMTSSPSGEYWKKMKSSYVPTEIVTRDSLRLADPKLRKELELKKPTYRSLQIMFVLDVTGSMKPAIDWLSNDIRKMMTAFRLMSTRPTMGITFYRDFQCDFVARTVPLTNNADMLTKMVASMPAGGGGDIPEAVREGLTDCTNKAGWVWESATVRNRDPKFIILVGDAPPHPETQNECEKIVKEIVARGVRVYVVKVMTPMGEDSKSDKDKGKLPQFDDLAEASKTKAFTVDFSQEADYYYQFLGKKPSKSFNLEFVEIARRPRITAPSRQLVTKLLLDTVDWPYKERLEPMIPIILDSAESFIPEHREIFSNIPIDEMGGGGGKGGKGGKGKGHGKGHGGGGIVGGGGGGQ